MDRPLTGGRLGPAAYRQPPPEPPLSVLLQRAAPPGELPPPSQDTQSTYFSQAHQALSQEPAHQPHGLPDVRKMPGQPISRWLTDPPGSAPPRIPTAGEPSQDSAVSGLSQDSGPSPAPHSAAPRTKSAALEQRIEQERQQRRQLERDVREAVTVVAAHVQALPELWDALLPRLLSGVERAAQTEAERAHSRAAERVSKLEQRLEGLDGLLRRAAEDGCRQSDRQVVSALHSLQQAVTDVEHSTGGTAESVQQLQRQLEHDRSHPAPVCLAPSDREAARQLTSAARQVTSAAQQVTSAVSEARRLSERLAEQLASGERRLALQASLQPAVAPPLAARVTCLTSPVGTVRPQPCLTHPRQNSADSGVSPPAKQPRAGDAPQAGSMSRQAPRIAAVAPKQAAPPQPASRTVRSTPSQGRRRPGSLGRRPREPAPLPPPLPAQRSGTGRGGRRQTLYSPESEVASLSELKGLQRANQTAAVSGAASRAADVYNFTWETEEPPWPRRAVVRTYSRTPQRTPLPPSGSPQEQIRRSVARPCHTQQRGGHWPQ